MRTITLRSTRWPALAATLVLAGCPGTLENPERFKTKGAGGGGDGSCPDIPALFAERCAGSGCHGATMPQLGLDLASPGVGARVAGQPAVGCTGLLADPANPEQSILYRKLTDAPPCGGRMPSIGEPLTPDEMECVREWIASLGAASGGSGGSGGASGAGGAGGTGGFSR